MKFSSVRPRIMRAMRGSMGSLARWWPRGVKLVGFVNGAKLVEGLVSRRGWLGNRGIEEGEVLDIAEAEGFHLRMTLARLVRGFRGR